MKYHFLTYATESHKFHALQLSKSAKMHGEFDSINIYDPENIDSDFKQKNSYIFNNTIGAGYWLWKPYVILQKLKELNEGDILCYCDSMYLFKDSIKNININESDIYLTHNKPNEPTYKEIWFSKRDALILMNCDTSEYYDTLQVWGGFIVIRKSSKSVQFIEEWLIYAQDKRIITNDKSTLGNEYLEFRENRHDQTALSLLAKKWKLHFNDFPQKLLFNLRVP